MVVAAVARSVPAFDNVVGHGDHQVQEGRAIAVEHPAEEHDRCPFPRPFAAGFSDCSTYQPVGFVAADSMNKRIGTVNTCGHLTVGAVAGSKGRFYPRCGLGDSNARQRWLLRMAPAGSRSSARCRPSSTPSAGPIEKSSSPRKPVRSPRPDRSSSAAAWSA
jgi:hypothetical protein